MKIQTESGKVLDLDEVQRSFTSLDANVTISHADIVLPLIAALKAALSVCKPKETPKNAHCLRWYECALEDVAIAAGVIEE